MNPISKKTGISFGLILAFYYLLANVIVFFADYTLFAKPYFGIVNMVVVLLLAISCVWITKKRLGNFITFKEGFSAFFIMIIIGFVTNMLLQFVLFNFVDSAAKEANNKIMIEMAQNIAKELSLPKEELEKQMEFIRNNPDDNFSFSSLIFSLAQSLLGASIAGLLISLTFRNKSEFSTPKTT